MRETSYGRILNCLAIATATVSLFGCGAGTSGSTSTPAVPAPTASISVSPTSITVGQSSTLTWSSTNSSTCTASGNWSGSQNMTGTLTLNPTAAGSLTYTLSCQNSAGVSASQSASLTVNAPPAPVVSIVVSPNTVAPGVSATLTWSATNASACTASGAWGGSQATSGTLAVSQSTIGNYLYSLSCTGTGGNASKTASLLVSNVKPSSYQNKNETGQAPVALSALGLYNAFAVADFFNDGNESLVVHTLEYNPNDPTTNQKYGHIHFYKQDQTGAWVDQTPMLLTSTTGCLHPRKALVVDFNRDGKPDVFFACHGLDAPPFPGEQPHVLMSQPDGTYANLTLPTACYCHGGAAADINGDGYPDVLVVDPAVAHTPFFFINHNGNGTFTQDLGRLPSSLLGKQIFSAELIDFGGSGNYDVFLAGNEPGTTNGPSSEFDVEILPNDGSGKFTSSTPVDLLVGPSFGLSLDVLFENGSIYLLKVDPSYTSSEIQKLSYPQLSGSIIYSHTGTYPNGSSWVDWILPYQQQIVSEKASFGLSVPQ